MKIFYKFLSTILIAIAIFSTDKHYIRAQSFHEEVLKFDASFVFFQIQVIDERTQQPILHLDIGDFNITENKNPQKIEYFSQMSEPMAINFILDISSSMATVIDDAKNALKLLIQNTKADDEIYITTFQRLRKEDELKKNQYVQYNDIKTQKINNLDDAISMLDPIKAMGFATPIYDVLTTPPNEFCQSTLKKKIIVLVSDGQESKSECKVERAMDAIKEAQIPIYTLTISARQPDNSLAVRSGEELMAKIARKSRGIAIKNVEPQELSIRFAEIFEAMRKSYIIGITPKLDRKRHKIKVEILSHRDAKILLSRDEYLGMKQDSQNR